MWLIIQFFVLSANPDDRVCSRQDDECVYQEIVRKLLARIDETCPFYSSFEERLVITSFEALTQNENVRSEFISFSARHNQGLHAVT